MEARHLQQKCTLSSTSLPSLSPLPPKGLHGQWEVPFPIFPIGNGIPHIWECSLGMVELEHKNGNGKPIKHSHRPLQCAVVLWPTYEALRCAVNCVIQTIVPRRSVMMRSKLRYPDHRTVTKRYAAQ